jgi:hypothetical protein
MSGSIKLVEKSVTAVKILRELGRELRKTNITGQFRRTADNNVWQFVATQARDHDLTQQKQLKGPGEVEHLGQLYVDYLASTRRLHVS